jgi:hypothetical protein
MTTTTDNPILTDGSCCHDFHQVARSSFLWALWWILVSSYKPYAVSRGGRAGGPTTATLRILYHSAVLDEKQSSAAAGSSCNIYSDVAATQMDYGLQSSTKTCSLAHSVACPSPRLVPRSSDCGCTVRVYGRLVYHAGFPSAPSDDINTFGPGLAPSWRESCCCRRQVSALCVNDIDNHSPCKTKGAAIACFWWPNG